MFCCFYCCSECCCCDSASNSSSINRKPRFAHLYAVELGQNQCPIVYAHEYNISFFGVERLHPFDSKKWGRVYRMLLESGQLTNGAVVKPKRVKKKDLLFVHSKAYLRLLHNPLKLAEILEVGLVLCFPHCLINRRVLRPMKFQTGGSVLAARLALAHGWAINIGGGFHHASRRKGGGFCVYADVTMCIRVLLEDGLIERAMIIDLDAHQGNGHEIDFAEDPRVYTVDFFNEKIYPHDILAKEGINRPVSLQIGTTDDLYISRLNNELNAAFVDFPSPNLVVFVAGTDSLSGDALGLLRLSSNGIIQRDQIVFRAARQRSIPIVLLTSGGYQRQTARVIADSILNLHTVGLIELQ